MRLNDDSTIKQLYISLPLDHRYGVRVGDWKGVVAHCSDNVTMAPSLSDDLMLYNLVADPFETTDIASAHPDQVSSMIKLLMAENVKCNCFQC